ncbi:Glutamine-dependent NAD(+) synthetase (NAD(+) synthase (glutamine-hydrolyzing)) (NadE) [Candidatus Glomeribacter gigasporarum BEG34]|uniref:Glutamine-dependent NAD(+) synthetase n=1 Tax=Candidatus Glomeribacter gigasporarum BEG34 TaxID=1070319 RepID=G2J8K8_9BURK|nr:NAD+ synthase [Candidatus Glomeribacter gigasporarum]CCD29105.1 Glutamine-dependent NAD(+) synthetase (NAD(+) synthase (glutamine-hydrolyzing)) (NadE) [Candidatus Glomeribacter gigasporarum BEG34]
MVRIALAQLNPTVGDFSANLDLIVEAAQDAYRQGARLLITPELAVSGYPPEDLLLRPAFRIAAERTLTQLAARLSAFDGFYAVIGHPYWPGSGIARASSPPTHPACYNAASVLHRGQVIGTYLKHFLPNTSVFDEQRYFARGAQPFIFNAAGIGYAVLICEDIWRLHVAQRAADAGAQILLALNSSPYHIGKEAQRMAMLRARTQKTGLPIVYVNSAGGQDELVFDGASCVLNAQGECVARMPKFGAGVALVDIDGAAPDFSIRGPIAPAIPIEAEVYAALMLGVRDYVDKNAFPGVLIGLSGGIDSALTLAIACDALGVSRVRAVLMPSPYTAAISRIDALEMIRRLGVTYDEIPITPVFEALRSALKPALRNAMTSSIDTVEENLQARIRGALLMALSNRSGAIVLTTGNKSEMAVGYCTLYGDLAGGFAALKDVSKTWVYRLAHYRNSADTFALRNFIPERILRRAPSAELRANQRDQDHLPPYEILDAIIHLYVEENRPCPEIIAQGFATEDVMRVARLIKANEHKRRQAPPGVRITARAFGRDWRYPITSRFVENATTQ